MPTDDARVDLEIELTHWHAGRCRLRLVHGPTVDVWPTGAGVAEMVVDEVALRAVESDVGEYGCRLGDALFADPQIRHGFVATQVPTTNAQLAAKHSAAVGG